MLKEALQFVFDKADEDRRARILEIPGNGRRLIIDHNGSLSERTIDPPLRKHIVRSVEDLIRFAENWEESTVWIDGSQIVLVLDRDDRRETVTLPLVESAIFRCVKSLKGPMDQAALVRLLRVELRSAINQPAILTAVRKVKFRQSSAGQSDIQHGNESMGQQVEAEVTGAGDIPEALVVTVNVFSNPGELENKATIGLDLEVDAKSQKFSLRTLPDEIERVTYAALLDIRSRIETAITEQSIYFGCP